MESSQLHTDLYLLPAPVKLTAIPRGSAAVKGDCFTDIAESCSFETCLGSALCSEN